MKNSYKRTIMQLIVNVPNENVMSKVIKVLKQFQNDGVEVTIDVKSDTYKMLEQIYGETKDEFLKMQLEHLPKNFEYKEKKSDKELLFEALKEKYEL